MERKTVLVTGFGPFKEHKTNASWEAVKLLPGIEVEGADLICEEIPVAYKAAEDKIKQLWDTHSPDLVIHVGVSSKADKITFETVAHRAGYIKTDAFGHVHPTGYCSPPENDNDILSCEVNVRDISDTLNQKNFVSCVSDEAGRFLCEYVFYKSLSVNRNKVIFVHVPVLTKPYTAQQLACALLIIIEEALKQSINVNVCECKS